jgi:dTDP-4-dehydrorhamnose 3,5-epimerase
MDVERLAIPDVVLISPTKRNDDRGFFSEVYRSDVFSSLKIEADFVQENHAFSAQRGVLRGLHFQTPPHAQGKLVRCVRGAVVDVAVDIRRGSPSFGRHVSVALSAENWRQVWIPPGFAHGYVTLEPNCEVIYKVTAYYHPASDRGIAWDDPTLAIDWRIPASDVIVSAKDLQHPRLADAAPAFDYGA